MSKPDLRKRAASTARFILRNTVIVFHTEHKNCLFVDKRNGKIMTVTPMMFKAVSTLPFKWAVFLAVFADNGRKYTAGGVALAPFHCYQAQLVDSLNDAHKHLIARVPERQRTGAGWIASPLGEEISGEQADMIFRRVEEATL